MQSCELAGTCIFFNDKMANMPSMADIYKDKYCREDSGACARNAIVQAMGREHVPADLYPNEMDRALAIVAG